MPEALVVGNEDLPAPSLSPEEDLLDDEVLEEEVEEEEEDVVVNSFFTDLLAEVGTGSTSKSFAGDFNLSSEVELKKEKEGS